MAALFGGLLRGIVTGARLGATGGRAIASGARVGASAGARGAALLRAVTAAARVARSAPSVGNYVKLLNAAQAAGKGIMPYAKLAAKTSEKIMMLKALSQVTGDRKFDLLAEEMGKPMYDPTVDQTGSKRLSKRGGISKLRPRPKRQKK